MAIATILAAVLGAGSSVAGGLLSQPKGDRPETAKIRGSGILSTTPQALQDPIIATLLANQLAGLGIVDPSLIQRASPVQQAINAARASGRFNASQLADATANLRSALADLGGVPTSPIDPSNPLEALGQFLGSENSSESLRTRIQDRIQSKRARGSRGFDRILQEAGYGSLEELAQAEAVFQAQVAPIADLLSGVRERGLQRQGIVDEALLGLTTGAADLSDFDLLRDAEDRRLRRELEDRRQATLVRANFGGFNPGRELEALSNLETDLPIETTRRATELTSGRQGILRNALGLLLALDPRNVAPVQTLSASAPATFAAPSSSAPNAAQAQGAQNVGLGVSGGADVLGQLLLTLGGPSTTTTAAPATG